MHDLRLAVRALRATPIVSIVATLSLALGIGANTAIFSIVNSLLLRALPVHNPQQLAPLTDDVGTGNAWTYAIWDAIRQRRQAFNGVFASSNMRSASRHSGRRCARAADRVREHRESFADS
jgi:hypothetical protein